MKLARLTDERLHAALNKLTGEALPLRTAFKLKGIIKTAREEFTKYEEVRKEALQRHGKKKDTGELDIDPATGNVQFEEAGIKAFLAELNELATMEIEVPTISISELGDKISLSVEELEVLDGIVVE